MSSGGSWLQYGNTMNKFKSSYIKGFLDICGNLTVREGNMTMLQGDISVNGTINVNGTDIVSQITNTSNDLASLTSQMDENDIIATVTYVDASVNAIATAIALKANVDSPIFTGNVGIGTNNPSSTLDISGDANILGTITATSFVGDGSGITGLASGGITPQQILDISQNTHALVSVVNPTNYDTVYGYNAMTSHTGGNSATCIGYDAGSLSNGRHSTYIGYKAGYSNLGGDYHGHQYNTSVGYQSGSNVVAGTYTYNTTIGYNAGLGAKATYMVAIGPNAGSGASVSGYGSLVCIGYQAGKDSSGHNGTSKNIYIGHRRGEGVYGSHNTLIGDGDNPDISGNIQQSTFIGSAAGLHSGGNDNNTTSNTFVGYKTSINNISGNSNTSVGNEAGTTDASGQMNICIGQKAGNWIGSGNATPGNYNTVIGNAGLYTDEDKVSENGSIVQTNILSIGSGYYPTSSKNAYQILFGRSRTIIGGVSVSTIDKTKKTVAIGEGAMSSDASSTNNTAIGYNALDSYNGGLYGSGQNVAVGYNSGLNVVLGEQLTFLGTNTTTDNPGTKYIGSTAVGYGASISDNSQIVLGVSSSRVDVPGMVRVGVIGLTTNYVYPNEAINTIKYAGSYGNYHTAQVGHGITINNIYGYVDQYAPDSWNVKVDDVNGHLQFNYKSVYSGDKSTYTSSGYISNVGSNTQFNFTGQHHNYGVNEAVNEVGFIVSSTGNYRNRMSNCDECNKFKITINESLPIVDYCSLYKDKCVFGVISDKDDNGTEREHAFGNFISVNKQKREDRPLVVNSVGEGAIWVSNINGIIVNGDYITSSDLPGLGTKQDDDSLHSYTVAKSTMGCMFDETELVTQKKLRYQIVTKTRENKREVETQVLDGYEYVFEDETYTETKETQIIDTISKLVYENITIYDVSGIPTMQRIQKMIDEEQPRILITETTDDAGNTNKIEEPVMETITVTKTRTIPSVIDVTLTDVSGNNVLDASGNVIMEQARVKQPIYKTEKNTVTTIEEYTEEESVIDQATQQFVYDIDTDASGNDIYIEKYDMKYILVTIDRYYIYNDKEHTDLHKEIQHDFTNITDISGNSIIGNSYKMAFVGCTYHCG
jgi:hypothetical protein